MRNKPGNGHATELQRIVDDIKAVVRDSEELFKAGYSGVKQRASAGAQTTNRIIRRHPYESIAIVFGLGFLAGMLALSSLMRPLEEE